MAELLGSALLGGTAGLLGSLLVQFLLLNRRNK